ncbi:MAG: Spore coat associated protein JA (CotJA) [Firmicutes bacterium ADurb.Bin373]|nr:MAG: Spore coat associated protein JA (CotJA) [Firmicutes bacterium ADurb.Bin373]
MFKHNIQSFYGQPGLAARDYKIVQNAAGVKSEDVQDVQATGLFPSVRLAQAFVIWQKYGPTFSPAEALEKGTLFPDLYSPYPY